MCEVELNNEYVAMNVSFDLAQIITIASVALIVIGWFVNQWLNRRNEIAKERRKYRIDMLRDFLQLTFYLAECTDIDLSKNKKLLDYLKNFYVKVHIFGHKDEMDLYGKIHNDIAVFNYDALKDKSQKIAEIVQNKIRKELKLEKV